MRIGAKYIVDYYDMIKWEIFILQNYSEENCLLQDKQSSKIFDYFAANTSIRSSKSVKILKLIISNKSILILLE